MAAPATPADAKGLLKSAIRDDDPVLVVENLAIYRERGEVPFLLYADGTGAQRIVTLAADRTRVVVGRSTRADLCLDWDSDVSRVHAELEHLGGVWTIADSKSRDDNSRWRRKASQRRCSPNSSPAALKDSVTPSV